MYYPGRQTDDFSDESRRLLTVNGIGTVSADPDVAIVRVGVVNQDQDLSVAQQQNAQIINQVIQSLIQMGIPETDIQTVDYYIFPEYDYVDGKQEFRGYQVTHMLSVTIEDLKQTGNVIDSSVNSGANRVSSIQFTLKDPQIIYQQALRAALGDALVKAQTVVNTLHLKLDPAPVKILETSKALPETPRNFAKSEAFSSSATPIEAGQLDIQAKVEVQFQYTS